MFNSISMTRMAATITKIAGTEPPKEADRPISQVVGLAEEMIGGKAERILIYNPDAIAMWLVQKYTDDFAPVYARAPLSVPMATVMPSVTPVCFGTMYTGVLPAVHGIVEYAKPVIKTDAVFDALERGGKKVALVAVADSSMDVIFRERNIDYYPMPYDAECNEKAKELIKEDKYDVVIVYNQEYDDMLHDTVPESPECLKAMENHINAFVELVDLTKEVWKDKDSMVVWASDHGAHINDKGFGDHGDYIEDDINVFHFYGIHPKQA